MKEHYFSVRITAVFLYTFLLLFLGHPPSVFADLASQNSCESEWCVCEGYTVDKLQYEDNHRILNDQYVPINSECLQWYFFWQQGGTVPDIREHYQNFLDYAQRECDKCRTNSSQNIPTETPTPVTGIQPAINEPADENQPSEGTIPCIPNTKLGDLDCDGIPDNEDLCLYTPGTTDRCGCGTLIAGDLLFRAGLASWLTTSPTGDFDFGHVAMYTGDIRGLDGYRNPHANGLTILKYDPDKQQFVKQRYREPYIYEDMIVIDSIIEADAGKNYLGAGISDIQNLVSDNSKFIDTTWGNMAFGRPAQGITCAQRKEAVQHMLYLAELSGQGLAPYELMGGQNCANYVLNAYRYAIGSSFLHDVDKTFLAENEIWPLSPNYLARYLVLYDFNGEKIYSPDNPPEYYKVSVGMLPSSAGRRYFIPYDSNVSWSLNSAVIQNKSSLSGKPLLSVYDAQDNFTGQTITDVVANIPGSEIFAHENEPTVINVYGHDSLLIQVNVDVPSGFQLAIYADGYPNPESMVKILYPESQFESNSIMQVELQPAALDPESLGMYIYQNGANYSDYAILPTVEIGPMQHSVAADEPENETPVLEVPSSFSSQWFLWAAVPGALCFGASFIILIAGVLTKNKKTSMLGIAIIAAMMCITMIAAAFYTGSRLLVPETEFLIDAKPDDPSSSEELPLPGMQPTAFVPAKPASSLTPEVPGIPVLEMPVPQEVSPLPTIYNFAACPSPCLSDLSNQQESFPEGTTRLYLRFDYDWIPPGSDYARVWKNGGQEWVRYQCQWDGPENGHFEADLREPAGFRSGEWTMETYVNGQLIAQNTFTMQGDSTVWDPAGTINRCK